MSSRKGQREEARARRQAEEQARAERARRQRNLRMLGGVLIAAVAVVAVAIAISGGSSTSKGLAQGKTATQNSTAVSQLLGGIPQSGARLGNPKAPVTLYYYGDLQCPICQQFTLQGGFPQLVANEVRSGKVQIVYRGLQTATRDAPTFQSEQVAALAAGKQNRFWNYAELFYREQGAEGSGYVNENYLTGLARQIPGLNLTEWQSARNDAALASQVQSDTSLATSSGFNATPTLVVQGPRGKTEPASTDYTDIQQAVKSVS
jgi:protein-disulfide isomerase